jgi:hypothetical protein
MNQPRESALGNHRLAHLVAGLQHEGDFLRVPGPDQSQRYEGRRAPDPLGALGHGLGIEDSVRPKAASKGVQ